MPSPSTISPSPDPEMNSSPSLLIDDSKKTMWPKKVENYVKKSSTKKNPDLTQEKLKEFKRKNEILYEQRRSSFTSGISPYNKGLTDSTLILNRQKMSGSSSSGKESDTNSTASSSISSFIVKMQGLSSWFSSPSSEERSVQGKSAVSSGKRHSKNKQASTVTTLTTLAKEMGLEGKHFSTTTVTIESKDYLSTKKKPLRERDSNTPSPPPQPKSPPSPLPRDNPPVPLAKPSPPQPNANPAPSVNFPPSSPPPKPSVPTPPGPHPSSPQPSLPPVPLSQFAKPFLLSTSLPPTAQPSAEQQPPVSLSPPPTPLHPKEEVPSPPPPPSQLLETLVTPTSPQQKGSLAGETKDNTNKITNEKLYLLADRYRPAALKDFLCNRDKARELQKKAKTGDCSHFIFEGPRGVGKRTMIWAFLREAFGPDRVQTREEVKQFDLQGEAIGSIKVTVKISLQHIEISLSEVKGYEKHVIVELIQETFNMHSKKALQCTKENCRVIILYDADKLSTDALLYIKWQLERYKGCNKVFFCCTNASKLQPIMSLCTTFKLLPPSKEEIIDVLEFIAEQEQIELSSELATRIANNSKNNLRQAIRSFEATRNANVTLKEDQIILTGWEDDIVNIAKNIVEEQSPKQLYNVRGKLQNLIEHNVCPEFIFEALMKELKECSVEEFHPQLDSLYKKYKSIAPNRHPAKKNLHQFMTIEEFIAKFMSCYKTSITKKKGV